jgi:hypothetical protein
MYSLNAVFGSLIVSEQLPSALLLLQRTFGGSYRVCAAVGIDHCLEACALLFRSIGAQHFANPPRVRDHIVSIGQKDGSGKGRRFILLGSTLASVVDGRHSDYRQ